MNKVTDKLGLGHAATEQQILSPSSSWPAFGILAAGLAAVALTLFAALRGIDLLLVPKLITVIVGFAFLAAEALRKLRKGRGQEADSGQYEE